MTRVNLFDPATAQTTMTRYLTKSNRTELSNYLKENKPRVLSREFFESLGWELPPVEKQKRFLASVCMGITISTTHFEGMCAVVKNDHLEICYESG